MTGFLATVRRLAFYALPVSTRVHKAGNDSPDLIRPIPESELVGYSYLTWYRLKLDSEQQMPLTPIWIHMGMNDMGKKKKKTLTPPETMEVNDPPKKEKKTVTLTIPDWAILSLLLGVIGTLIGVIYNDMRDDIKQNTASLETIRNHLILANPRMSLAAYTVAASTETGVLPYEEAQTVFDALVSHDYATDMDAQPDEVRDVLTGVGSLDELQVERVSNSYFHLDPQETESWTSAELETITEGLELTRQVGSFPVFADRVAPDLTAPTIVVLFVLFVALLLTFIVRVVIGIRSAQDNERKDFT